jgi:hypothetical protein
MLHGLGDLDGPPPLLPLLEHVAAVMAKLASWGAHQAPQDGRITVRARD